MNVAIVRTRINRIDKKLTKWRTLNKVLKFLLLLIYRKMLTENAKKISIF